MDNATHKQTLARNIRYYMALKGVTKQQLCESTGINYSTFREWYNGRIYPKIGAVETLANYFGCEKSDLIEDRLGKPIDDDELSESQKALIQFAHTVPDDKAEMMLRVMRSILAND